MKAAKAVQERARAEEAEKDRARWQGLRSAWAGPSLKEYLAEYRLN
jgi:hypothetical protein